MHGWCIGIRRFSAKMRGFGGRSGGLSVMTKGAGEWRRACLLFVILFTFPFARRKRSVPPFSTRYLRSAGLFSFFRTASCFPCFPNTHSLVFAYQLLPLTVRRRPPRLHRQKHLLPRSIQIDPLSLSNLRGKFAPLPSPPLFSPSVRATKAFFFFPCFFF